MLVVGVLVLVAVAVGGTLFFMMPAAAPAGAPAEGGATAAPVAMAQPLATPTYISMDPPLLLNFEDAGGLRYLQVNISIMTRDSKVAESLINIKPRLRNDLLVMFSKQDLSVITSGAGGMAKGMELLQTVATEALRESLKQETGLGTGIEAVYFTNFVMQ